MLGPVSQIEKPNPSHSDTCQVLLLAIVLLVHTDGLKWTEAVVGRWGCGSGDVGIQLFTVHVHAWYWCMRFFFSRHALHTYHQVMLHLVQSTLIYMEHTSTCTKTIDADAYSHKVFNAIAFSTHINIDIYLYSIYIRVQLNTSMSLAI